jgi:hypothetical protein
MSESEAATPEVYTGPPYSELLAQYLQKNTDEPLQAPEVNKEITQIVTRSIAKYPQHGNAAYLIADSVMHGFDSQDISGHIGIRELALFIPDPDECAEIIKRYHELFGIPKVVEPTEAAHNVSDFSIQALKQIQRFTLDEAKEQGVRLPDDIEYYDVHGRKTRISGPWSVNRRVCFGLNDFLVAHPAIRNGVTERLSGIAQNVRSGSKEQQDKFRKPIGKKEPGNETTST